MNKIISVALLASALLTTTSTHSLAEPANASNVQKQMLTINVNQAGIKELSQLKGIGEVKAKAIVSYRELNGRYNSLDDLLKVKGIGDKVLADNIAQLSI